MTLAPKLSKDDGEMDFTRPAEEIARHVRAMTTWPGARCTLEDGRDLVVLAARATNDAHEGQSHEEPPGTRLERGSALVFAAGKGTAIEFTLVKPAGKGAMEGAAFLRGLRS